MAYLEITEKQVLKLVKLSIEEAYDVTFLESLIKIISKEVLVWDIDETILKTLSKNIEVKPKH